MSERYYIDCEFDGHAGPLLSLALVPAEGASLYIRTWEQATNPWVIEHVMPLVLKHRADRNWRCSLFDVGGIIRQFMGDCPHPVIVADSPVDLAYFCVALLTDGEGDYSPNPFPRMTFEVHDVESYPTDLPGAVQHNAWWDAMALRHKLRADV